MSDWHSFLASRGARIGAAGVSDFGDPSAELAAARDRSIVADLSDNAVLAIAGDDATAFLHGQFTNDVQAMAPGTAQWNGWCSAKGRLLATFVLVRRAEDFLLLLPQDIADAFTKRLRMFVLRSKVKIEDANERYVRIGAAGKTVHGVVARHWGASPAPMHAAESGGAVCVALGADRFVVLVPPQAAPALWEAFAREAVEAGLDAWEWTGIRAGIPVIHARTQEEFVPQMANLDLVGGVSFKKGCYPGQEIVARTQYRGILKKRMARVHAAGEGRPAPGDPVYGASFGEQAVGTVVEAAPSPEGGFVALVVAQIESLDKDELRLGSPGGAILEVRDRPLAAA